MSASSTTGNRVIRLWIVATVCDLTHVKEWIGRDAWKAIQREPVDNIISGLAYIIDQVAEAKGDLERAIDSLLDSDDLSVRSEIQRLKEQRV